MDFDGWKRRPDQGSLSALLVSVEPRVERICRRILRDPHDAEEAKQEVLLEIASGLDSISDGGHFDRWVGRLAFRTALDRLRMRKRRVAREHSAAGRAPNGAARDDDLHEAMSSLDDGDRDLIIERYFDRRTFREMGRRHGISAVAVRKRIAGAQDRLKRMLGAVMSIGVTTMRAKTAAAATVVLIPLLVLGVGVGVATARRNTKPAAEAARPKPNPKIETWIAESKDRGTPKSMPSESVAVRNSPLERAQVRAVIVATLERLRYVGRRAAECKQLWPDASTEEEGRALQREKVALDAEYGELSCKLCELAAQDPEGIVDLVRSARELPERVRLMGLIAPDVDVEIASEDAPAGPLLSGILTLAMGDVEERMHLAAFAGQLTRANRDIGIILVALMKDSDGNVRMNAAHALTGLALTGQLKNLLTRETAVLQQLSLLDEGPMDYHTRGSALIALASLGTDPADDWVLHRFESATTLEHFNVRAMEMAASRIVQRHEARLVLAMGNAVERAHGSSLVHLRRLAELLPEASRTEFQRAYDAKVARQYRTPTWMTPRMAPQGKAQRRMTSVTRFSMD